MRGTFTNHREQGIMLDTPNHSNPNRPSPQPGGANGNLVRWGVCPTCGVEGLFHFHGEQRWPERVADKLGMKPLMHLWTCDTCHTTFAEPTDTP
jgi:hypothetical protein